MTDLPAVPARLRLYMSIDARWVQIGWVQEYLDRFDEFSLIENVEDLHKKALINMIAGTLMGQQVELRLTETEIPETDPETVMIHIVNNEEESLALCTNEHFVAPTTEAGVSVELCGQCLHLHKIQVSKEQSSV